jgi:hypothetical protein
MKTLSTNVMPVQGRGSGVNFAIAVDTLLRVVSLPEISRDSAATSALNLWGAFETCDFGEARAVIQNFSFLFSYFVSCCSIESSKQSWRSEILQIEYLGIKNTTNAQVPRLIVYGNASGKGV